MTWEGRCHGEDAATALTLTLALLRVIERGRNTFIERESFKHLPAVSRNITELSVIEF